MVKRKPSPAAPSEKTCRQMTDLVLDYLTNSIDYSLDQENLEGLNLFFQLAREYRFVNSLRGLEFLETS